MPAGAGVLGFGAVAVDDIIYVAGRLGGGKGAVRGRRTMHGGNVGTALAAVAQLGVGAAYVGPLGPDPAEVLAAQDLERWGVSLAHAPRDARARVVRSTILVDEQGERFIAFDDAALRGQSVTLTPEVLSGARVLLVDAYASWSLSAVHLARALGLAVVADIEFTLGGETDELTALADHLVLPYAWASAMTQQDEPGAILDALWSPERAAVVVTHGARGAYLRANGQPGTWHQPALAVEVVDTTGCGDCFHGAYAAGLALGQAADEAFRAATAAAALAATAEGGRGHLATQAEVEALLAAKGTPALKLL